MHALIALAELVGPSVFYAITDRCRPEDVFTRTVESLTIELGLCLRVAQRIAQYRGWEELARRIEEASVSAVTILTCEDPRHPRHRDPSRPWPPVLYVKGSEKALARLADPGLAVVGSRSPSRYGLRQAHALGMLAARRNVPLISGMALGVDGAAHSGCLDQNGTTFAVLGSGVDQPYPPAHLALYRRIIDHDGAVLSFFPLGTPPLHRNFPIRNELIALLSGSVAVVQAAARSGSLHTARFAQRHDRPLWALVGAIDDPLHEGCHDLIRNGTARALFRPQDALDGLGDGAADADRPSADSEPGRLPFVEPLCAPAQSARRNDRTQSSQPEMAPATATLTPPDLSQLDESARRLYQFISEGMAHMDDLAARAALSSAETAGILLTLTMEGLVDELPGHWYCIHTCAPGC